MPAAEHVPHDRGERPVQEMGEREPVGRHRAGDEHQELAQVGGQLVAAQGDQMIDRCLEALPGLFGAQLGQVLEHPTLGDCEDGVEVGGSRLLAQREPAGAARFPRQLHIEAPVARGGYGCPQGAVHLDQVVGDGDRPDVGQRRQSAVGGTGPEGFDGSRGRGGIEAIMGLPVGGHIPSAELPER